MKKAGKSVRDTKTNIVYQSVAAVQRETKVGRRKIISECNKDIKWKRFEWFNPNDYSTHNNPNWFRKYD